ncbi:MAG: 1-acyl-sn-glycerol-3-phosphate acyltransferase, partial [Lachnospiraceae bacterium]|nr:1-acyl-sn-glycerol-3-phosphate acyltransferase [Lachnospiraceae bacterium]
MMHNGRIKTESTGQERLPKEGGYVMYSNHQGK